MSIYSLTRAASNTREAAASLGRSAGRTAGSIAAKHSRMSIVAASAAAAGLLGASGFAVGAAPWAQAVGNVAATVQGDGQGAAGQSGSFLFGTISGTKTASSTTHLDALQSAKPSGLTAAALNRHAVTAKPAAAKQNGAQRGTAKAGTARTATAKAASARVVQGRARAAAARVAAAKAAAARPFTLSDSVEPGRIPSGQPAAVYATGAYAAQPSSVSGHRSVLWIDTNGSDPGANVLDVEPGDATPAGAAQWVKARLHSHANSTAIVYTMRSDWQQVKDNVADLPSWMQSKVKYWIADPTGVPHVVPGSSATQWYWGSNYDITTANPGF